MDNNFTHLGHPLILPAKNRTVAYNFVIDKFLNKLPAYKANMLSHAARLELIRSVFSAIPVYYMSNILFTKKFIAKLTAIIRNFWWTGIRENNSNKSLCIRAWKDICNYKQEGGLGIRNLQAINEGLLLAAAWRLAKDPSSHLHLVLKSKYFHDASIWTAISTTPKSAFWSSILKMLPKLKDHSFYQLTQGNISLWSTPWCSLWASVHDNLIIQPSGYIYPSLVKDLWIPGQKVWNNDLINSLFQQPLASVIVQTDIIHQDCPDILCWDLTPNGTCSSKSTYKLCLQDIHVNPRNTPSQVSLQMKNLLKLIWKQKLMIPRVQTFAWRLLRKALPTGLKVGRFSVHISQYCCRCGQQEDEVHMFFFCDFARAAWFSHPWFIRTDALVQIYTNIHSIILALLNMNHPHASVVNILNFMWCLWKARNDYLFNRKKATPHQVNIAATSLSNDFCDLLNSSSHHQPQNSSCILTHTNQLPLQGQTLKSDLLITGPKVYTDASFKCKKIPGLLHGTAATGVGIYISLPHDQKEVSVQIQASTSITSTPLQAEAFALLLAAKVAKCLNISQPTFLTDCLSLASFAASRKITETATPWTIRKVLADFFCYSSDLQPRVFHISREINGIAH
uniref:Reverse transcriptase zinc-binding domain-containing protein n=1 Tax=Triticum urartu TaxID=4572 RepID=A0A8R7UVC7_TRIUA